jgi:hypothetical protein
MEINIEKIVADFAINIQNNIKKISNTIKIVKDKIQILRDIYVDLIEKNNHKQIFLFCLESFNFQNKTLLFESEHFHKTFNILLNRTYRDYYKLYNIILKLFDEYKLENKTQKKHPEYRDLDVNAEFTLEEISNIHDDVIYLTCVLIDKYKESEALIRQYKTKSKTGIYIINLINTIEYDNAILKDQIDLYINYLFFFQNTQTTYFEKLDTKLISFLNEIDQDIKFQNPEEPDTEEPDTEEPEDEEPDAKEPDAKEPDAKEPDAKEPDGNVEVKKNEILKKEERVDVEAKKEEIADVEAKKEEPVEAETTFGISSNEIVENIEISIVKENVSDKNTLEENKNDKRRGGRRGNIGLQLF